MRSASHLELVRGSVTTAATLAHERTLPVSPELSALLPSGGLQRGSTMAIHGSGATSLGLAMVGQAVRDGSFLAVVAPSSFNLAPCLDYDIPLRRVVQFVLPSAGEKWAQAVAAIVEGFDVVLIADRHRVRPSQLRLLTARNRERGSVLVRVGGGAWPEAADLRLDVNVVEWNGLGQGHGHLAARQVAVQVAGRRHHARPVTHELLLPAPGGGVLPAGAQVVEPVPARFAGADIDDMLDVVDAAHQVEESASSTDVAGGHLNAIA